MNSLNSGYEYIAHTIKGYGVTHVFYVEAILRMALRELGDLKVNRIMAHTENAAAYMADGYARVSGKPGVCLAQSIGAANLAGGVHEAWLANSPLIALTGKKSATSQYRGAYQEADHRLLYEGITKFNADVSNSEQLSTVLRQCFRVASTGKPRPVHVDLSDHMGREIELGSVTGKINIEEIFAQYPAFRPEAQEDKINEAVDALVKAKKPILVIGRGAAISGAGDTIYQLAKKTDIPVVTSPDGKALIDENDALWAGIVGGYGMDCANKSVMAADLVIFIGTQTGDQTTFDWKVPSLETRVVQIDIDPIELGKNYPNSVCLLGDAKVVVEQLLEKVKPANRKEWRNEVKLFVKDTLGEYSQKQTSDAPLIRPERLCAEISKVLPEDAVLVADTGFSAVWSATMLRMKPSQKYIRAAGSLGWSYPGSLGVKCGAPERPVICFTGDGAFYYHLNEMETANRYGIKTVTVVNNNNALAQCAGDLSVVYKDAPEKMAERYCYPNVNFSKIAKEYGCWSIRVDNPGEIGPAIEEAIKADAPAVVEVITDKDIFVPDALKKF
jgi:acetolactate synthase-1/2/3 large subunit